MEVLRIEILNRKAMQLIKGMQELNLIKVSEEPASKVKAYLKKNAMPFCNCSKYG
jgi:hypothetical protein